MLPGLPSLMLARSPFVAKDADAIAYFAAMPAQPSDPFKKAVEDYIVGCKADGTWTIFDRFALLCLDTPQLNRVDMRYPTKSITETAGGTYTPGKGWKGDGVSAFLDVGQKLSPAEVAATNAASIGGYVNGAGVAGSGEPLFGVTSTVSPTNRLIINDATNGFATALNGGTTIRTVANRTGLFTVSRSNSSTVNVYVGATNIATDSSSSNGSNQNNLWIGRDRGSYTTQRIALAYAGGAFTQANMTAINQRIMTMLTAMGAT